MLFNTDWFGIEKRRKQKALEKTIRKERARRKSVSRSVAVRPKIVLNIADQDVGIIQAIENLERYHNEKYVERNGYKSLAILECNQNHVNYIFNIPKPVHRIGSALSQIAFIKCRFCGEKLKGGEIIITNIEVEND